LVSPNQQYYSTAIENGFATLDEVESRHCVSVLRKNPGDALFVTDGKGAFYSGILVEAHKKRAVIEIQKTFPQKSDRKIQLHIAISLSKQNDRFEWFLEKATELGIDRITPLVCKRTEKSKFRKDRAEKIVLSAMKQSAQAFLPQLDDLTKFKDLITDISDTTQKIIPYCDGEAQPLIQEVMKPEGAVCILIGPAGDFTPEEVELAQKKGFIAVSLGDSRLRLETAGVAVACVAKFLK